MMKNTKKSTMGWVVGVGLMLAAGSAAAQPFNVPPGRWWERPMVAAKLALSPDQVKQLDAATYAFALRMVDLKAAVEKDQIDLRALSEAEPFMPGKVRDAFAALQQARVKLESERFDMLLKVREVLNPEQWAKLQQLARERRAERGNNNQPPRPGAGQRNAPPQRWR